MGVLDWLFKRKFSTGKARDDAGASSTRGNQRISNIYSKYAVHSINNNTEDEAYERLAAIQRSLTKGDITLFREAAEAGNPESMCLLAAALLEGWECTPDRKKAAYWLRKAAESGNASAQDTLAGFYRRGAAPDLGFTRNVTEAIRLYRLAAEQGFGKSQSTLGSLLREDPSTAAEGLDLIKKAAEQGIWSAMFNLAVAYETGNDVSQNLDLALQWYQKADKQGLIQARKKVEKLRAAQ